MKYRTSSPLSVITCAGLLATIAFLTASPAAAADDTKLACVAASAEGQRLRDEGDLLGARTAFLSCSAASCPGLVQEACVDWVADLGRQVPSLVISVRDADGQDLAGATVVIDGHESSAAASGEAVELNPGQHVIRVKAARIAEERKVTLAVGEQRRMLQFAAQRAPATPAAAPAAKPQPSTSLVLPGALAGVSAVALGVSLYLGASVRSQRDELDRTCAPDCSDGQVTPLRSKLLAGDVLLAVSAVTAVGAAWFFFSMPSSNSTEVGLGPATLAVRGQF